MHQIHITTVIHAPIEKVFDLARTVDMHLLNLEYGTDKIIIGKRHGMYVQEDESAWQIKRFFKESLVQLRVSNMQPHDFFFEEIVHPGYIFIKQAHHFKKIVNGTIMIEVFEFENHYGKAGSLMNTFVHAPHFKKLLEERSSRIKNEAEKKSR